MQFYNLLKKIFLLLSSKEKKQSFILFFFVLIGIILESIGIVLLLPISSLLIDAEIPTQFEKFENILIYLKFTDNLLFTALITVFLVFFFKNLYLLILNYFQIKFTQSISLRLSTDLFARYLNSNFSFHLNSNTSFLVRNLQEAGSFESIYRRAISLITEIIVTIAFFSLFLLMDLQTTLLVSSVFLFSGSLFIFVFKNKIPVWGKIRHETTGEYLKIINHGLNGIKEIVFSNGQNYFIKKAKNIKSKFLNSILKLAVIDFMPRVLIEMLIILSVVTAVSFLVLSGKNYEYIVPLLTAYVAAAFRLGPACNRIINHIQSLNFSNAPVENLYQQFIISEKNNQNIKSLDIKNKINFNDNIFFENISFSFKERLNIYSNINIKFSKNKIYGITGSSGSGKSTFINLLTGLLDPTSGKIFTDGVDINTNLEYWQRSIAYVAQDLFLTDDTILNNIAFGRDKRDIDINQVKKIVSQVELKNFINNLNQGFDTIVGEKGLKISGGQRQRIALARALYQNPKILILDEATNSLDEKTEEGILNTLKNFENITIFMVSHQKSSLSICDEIYEIKNNEIIKI
jgi:ABC-type multidrug transport system fused ATPase/permease subunit